VSGLPVASAAISSSARLRLFSDHLLLGLRGVKRTSHQSASNGWIRPSIQPLISAPSIASALPTEGAFADFLASFSQSPGQSCG
jgi:hypothetical protein